MTLRDLLSVLEPCDTDAGTPVSMDSSAVWSQEVSGVAYDSRKVRPAALFVGLRGQYADGSTFAGHAIASGAIAVVSEQAPPAATAVPWVRVQDARLTLARLAAGFYGHPSRAMQVVGITGTNGKTTTAYLVRDVLEAGGLRCGLLGTVQYRIGSEVREASRTTPEAVDLQQMLRDMADAGCRACAMEVSSHALALRRADQTRFAAGVFTNLTRDHLDFHQDLDRYFAAKRRLFDLLPPGAPAILNADDPRVAALATERPVAITYGISQTADLRPVSLPDSLMALSFDVRTPAGILAIRSRLAGLFNVYNLLAAAATGVGLGLPLPAIEAGLAALTDVPGRFQVVSSAGDDIAVIVDYAHTDDALKNLLEAARPLAAARLITVFGCGGDRDRTKRPLMGAVAARLSDLVILTSDNPRSEDPDLIIDEIERGIAPAPDRTRATAGAPPSVRDRAGTPWLRVTDRRAAIARAIGDAGTGDLVVIAGKGHEQSQVLRDRVLPFDDVAVAREELSRRRVEVAR